MEYVSYERLIRNLVAERKRQGLSQRDLGRKINTGSSSTLSKWESFECTPSYIYFEKWATALGCDVQVLFPVDAQIVP